MRPPRAGRGLVQAWANEPLLRNGYALVLNVGLTTVLGVAFWVIAAREYSAADVGRGSALVSALLLLSSLGQFGLTYGLPRFLPTAGPRAGGLLARGYAVTGAFSVLLALGFVLLAPDVSSELSFLRSGVLPVLAFCGAALAWTVFVLQDSAIMGLRRSVWIPVENTAYGALKLLLLIPFAAVLPRVGVFAAWVIGAVVLLVPVNLLIFRRWIPAHAQVPVPNGHGVRRLRDIGRFLTFDYLGQVCYMASTAALPLLVVSQLGVASNGYFYVAWMMATCLDLVSVNLAQSLVVEAAVDPAMLARHLRRLLPQLLVIQGTATIVVILGARLLLSAYGEEYAKTAVTPLRLLMLALLPRAVIVMSIAIKRVQRRVERILVIQATTACGVLGLAAVLARPWGLTGVALAWLVAQTCVSLALLPGLLRAAWGRRPSEAPAGRVPAGPAAPPKAAGTIAAGTEVVSPGTVEAPSAVRGPRNQPPAATSPAGRHARGVPRP